MSESQILTSVEACAMHYRICVLPRNPKRLSVSVWSMVDPAFHTGVIWRNNTGGARLGRQFVRFGMSGLPDFIGIRFPMGKFFTIEVKSEKGRSSPDQKAYAQMAQRTGVLAGLVRSYDDCEALLKGWGFSR